MASLTWVINGSMTHVVELEEGELAARFSPTRSMRLQVVPPRRFLATVQLDLITCSWEARESGLPGAMVIDTSALGLSVKHTTEAQNAAISLGEADSGILLTSTTNTFTEVIDGVKLQASQASDTATTITISRDDVDLVATVQVMVENYNKFRDRYNDLTSYNEMTGESAVLFGDSTAREVGSDLGWAIADRYVGVGEIQTIRELGVTINVNDGTLSLDEATLKAKFAEDPAAVKEFFSADPTKDEEDLTNKKVLYPEDIEDLMDKPPVIGAKGFAAVLNETLDSLVGVDVSLLARRYTTLETKITSNEEHVEFLSERLEAQRERMLWDFYYMELAISKLQSNQTAIDSIATMNLDGSSGNN